MPPKYHDPRLKAISLLHKHKEIVTFDDIWKHIPKSIVANEMGIGHGRFNRLIAKPANFTYNEIAAIAALFEMEFKALSKMVEETIK